jgi:PhzF family phenazine biosynthesis protein
VKIPFYQLDAFTSESFGGNSAAVCPLERWPDDYLLQAVAAENNLAETAFFVPDGDGFELRWFTPALEVQLCGHATLASAYVIFNHLNYARERIAFQTRSGRLEVSRDGERLVLDFPSLPPRKQQPPALVADAISVLPQELWGDDRAMAVLGDAAEVRELRPNVDAIAALPLGSLIVTAPGFPGDCDFVSRYFAPKYGIAEDSVTGSAHCVLTPYWAGVLNKPKLFARQLSARGGELWVEDCGQRVRIAGHCVPVIEGTLTLSR